MASKKDLRSYFNVVSENKKKKDSAVSISEIIVSETSDVSQAEVDIAREQVKKQVMQRKSYQVVPEKVKIEVGRYAALNETKAALKRYSKIYPKYDLKRTSVNSWKSKIKDKKENSLAKRSGRPNLLSDDLLKKTKDIIIGTRNAGTVIRHHHWNAQCGNRYITKDGHSDWDRSVGYFCFVFCLFVFFF